MCPRVRGVSIPWGVLPLHQSFRFHSRQARTQVAGSTPGSGPSGEAGCLRGTFLCHIGNQCVSL